MLKKEIKVGGNYYAKVGLNLTTVIVNNIAETKAGTRYDVTNIKTGRSTIFRSAAKFRYEIKPEKLNLNQETPVPKITKPNLTPEKKGEALPELKGKTIIAKDSSLPVDPEVLKETRKLYDGQRSTVGDRLKAAKEATENLPPHTVVKAFAGTGKTFTQIVGVGYAFGQPVWDKIQRGIAQMIGADPETFRVQPSDEQQKVWDALAQSRGTVKTVTYCAFNKRIVTEFGEKWGWMVALLQNECGVTLNFATINGLGYRTVANAYGGRIDCTDARNDNLVAAELGQDIRIVRLSQPVLLQATSALVQYVKLTLSGWTEGTGFNIEEVTDDVLDDLSSYYDVETNGTRAKCYALVRKILAKSLEQSYQIDFDDQNWLPVVKNLAVTRVDLLLVDEAQDLNRCKQEYCRKVGRRVFVTGDDFQAIYGFAGADAESIPRMTKLLNANVLRLTETRRCGRAIVKEAQRVVKDFRAHESNVEGVVRRSTIQKWASEAKDGDMALCRVNAPLVSQALKLIRDGRKAIIIGRDFGKSLVSFIDRLKATSPGDLVDKAQEWGHKEAEKEAAKKNPSDARIQGIEDRVSCIEAFAEDAETVGDVTRKIWEVFAGKVCTKCGKNAMETAAECWQCKTATLVTPKGVQFSSIHRAKGLEADRVFILLPKGAELPHPMAKTAWQKEQERNLLYVAITRAIHELVYVDEPKL